MGRVNVGLAIRKRRKDLGLSQSELASRLGYKDHSTLAKVETGVNDITVDTLFKYAEALGLSATDLLSCSSDEAKGIYRLGFDCLPALPNIRDCKVERITVGQDSLLLVFERNIARHDSVSSHHPKADSLEIEYRLIGEPELYVEKHGKMVPFLGKALEDFSKEGLIYLCEYVGYQSVIIKLCGAGLVILNLTVDQIHYRWAE
ncbi:MAG: helix-turn-helix domain-containing protein [Candidatus Enteromonas sp.]|nr:helix-turn-helix domain-containing protein [Candidatus Enteromonas sp.]